MNAKHPTFLPVSPRRMPVVEDVIAAGRSLVEGYGGTVVVDADEATTTTKLF